MDALSDGERKQATIGQDLPGELLTAEFRDNRRIEPTGIRYPDLLHEGRERLEALLCVYTGRIRRGHGEVRWAEVKRLLDATHFAWIGPVDDHSPFYYCILSSVILVEFDHQSGIATITTSRRAATSILSCARPMATITAAIFYASTTPRTTTPRWRTRPAPRIITSMAIAITSAAEGGPLPEAPRGRAVPA